MKNVKKIYKIIAVVIAIIVVMIYMLKTTAPNTSLNKNGFGIAVNTKPANWKIKKLDKLPQPDSNSQLDLRSSNLSNINLNGKETDLLNSTFDTRTKWPKNMPSKFSPEKIMKFGKKPGLGLEKLHQSGIKGQGVGIAIIDDKLLINHNEYKDRIKSYEEIHCGPETSMHGPAVTSIAIGKTVGVAPEADLYYIGVSPSDIKGFRPSGEINFKYIAQSIDRIVEINKKLPKGKKIRVISISIGWSPISKGYSEVMKSVEKAKKENIFVVSSSLKLNYGFNFNGLGRNPLSDPDISSSYLPGLFWQEDYFKGNCDTTNELFVPMDSRCTASPTGYNDYTFYSNGGKSWAIPYIAGVYTLACQVKPNITPNEFWKSALKTGDSTEFKHNNKTYKLGEIINPSKLIKDLK